MGVPVYGGLCSGWRREDGGAGGDCGGKTTTLFEPSKTILSNASFLLTLSAASFHTDGNIVAKVLTFNRVEGASVSRVKGPARVGWSAGR